MRAATSWTKANNSASGGQRLFMAMRHHARMMKYPETPQTKRPPSISLPICPSLMTTYGIRCHWPWTNLASAPSRRIDLWRLRGRLLAFLESPQWTESEFPDCQKSIECVYRAWDGWSIEIRLGSMRTRIIAAAARMTRHHWTHQLMPKAPMPGRT